MGSVKGVGARLEIARRLITTALRGATRTRADPTIIHVHVYNAQDTFYTRRYEYSARDKPLRAPTKQVLFPKHQNQRTHIVCKRVGIYVPLTISPEAVAVVRYDDDVKSTSPRTIHMRLVYVPKAFFDTRPYGTIQYYKRVIVSEYESLRWRWRRGDIRTLKSI